MLQSTVLDTAHRVPPVPLAAAHAAEKNRVRASSHTVSTVYVCKSVSAASAQKNVVDISDLLLLLMGICVGGCLLYLKKEKVKPLSSGFLSQVSVYNI